MATWTQAHYQFPYGTYLVTMSYEKDYGNLVVPHSYNSSDSNTVSVIPRSQKISTLTVTWVAKRAGYRPVIPCPTPQVLYAQLVLLSTEISPLSTVLPEEEGNPVFQISGTYVYICKQPIDLDAYAPIGGVQTPYDANASSSRDKYTSADISYQILPI